MPIPLEMALGCPVRDIAYYLWVRSADDIIMQDIVAVACVRDVTCGPPHAGFASAGERIEENGRL